MYFKCCYSHAANLHGINPKLSHVVHSPRRKSVSTIPLSPLARTPSNTMLNSSATLPARSTSPLAIKGSQGLLSPTSVSPSKSRMSSPLLRRALSPDRSGRSQKPSSDDRRKIYLAEDKDSSSNKVLRSKSLRDTRCSGKYS